MGTLNKVLIIGNLGQDPEVRYTQSNTAVATLSVATTERFKDKNGEWKEKTEWHRVVLWARLAEIAQEYLSKGSKVFIEGVLQTRSWEDKGGQTRYTTEIKGLRLVMLDSRSEQSGGGGQGRPPHPGESPSGDSGVTLDEGFDDLDDDLPF